MASDDAHRGATDSGPGRKRLVGFLVLAIAAGVVTGFLLTRAPGTPGPPANVSADPFRCTDPCRRLDAAITVRWAPPTDGADPSGYEVWRDGTPLPLGGQFDEATAAFTDRSVTFGERYEYQVVALSSAGASAGSAPVSARLPRPPATSAQLDGVYAVRLTVTDARSLSSMLSIEQPRPGVSASDRWTFEPVCTPPMSGCPARWEGLDGPLVPHGRSWAGTVAGPDARCGGATTVPAPTRFRLESATAQGVEDAWLVDSFRGSVTISFHCPGFPVSHGSVEVTGRRT